MQTHVCDYSIIFMAHPHVANNAEPMLTPDTPPLDSNATTETKAAIQYQETTTAQYHESVTQPQETSSQYHQEPAEESPYAMYAKQFEKAVEPAKVSNAVEEPKSQVSWSYYKKCCSSGSSDYTSTVYIEFRISSNLHLLLSSQLMLYKKSLT